MSLISGYVEKETNHVLTFLDILVDNTSTEHTKTSISYQKKTFIGLFTNFRSFSPMTYKIGLIRTLTDRIFKINNSWLGFHNDIKKLISLLRKNLFPEHIIDNCKTIDNSIAKALSVEQPSSNNTVNAEVSEASKRYYKLPYIGRFTIITQRKLSKLVNRYCKETNIKLVF